MNIVLIYGKNFLNITVSFRKVSSSHLQTINDFFEIITKKKLKRSKDLYKKNVGKVQQKIVEMSARNRVRKKTMSIQMSDRMSVKKVQSFCTTNRSRSCIFADRHFYSVIGFSGSDRYNKV